MAKQIGIFPLSGSLDNVTFFQTADGGYRVRKKSRLNRELMAAMPAFDRTREHNSEFATAARAMKILRSSIKALLINTADRKSALRLRHTLTDCLHADTVSIRGQRSPQNGDLSLLKGFDFNNRALLHTVFAAPITTTIDRPTGTLSLDIPAFNPKAVLKAPPQATHFRILMAGAAIDFLTEAVESSTTDSGFLPLTPTSPMALTVTITPNTTANLLTFLSIHFYEETNGVKYPLHTANPLTIVDVEQSATSTQTPNTFQPEPDQALIPPPGQDDDNGYLAVNIEVTEQSPIEFVIPCEAKCNEAKTRDPLSPPDTARSRNSPLTRLSAFPTIPPSMRRPRSEGVGASARMVAKQRGISSQYTSPPYATVVLNRPIKLITSVQQPLHLRSLRKASVHSVRDHEWQLSSQQRSVRTKSNTHRPPPGSARAVQRKAVPLSS